MKTLEKTQTIKLQNKTIILKKLPLRKIVALLNDIKNLPPEISNLDKMSTDEVMGALPLMIAGVMPVVVGSVVKAVDDPQVTEEFLLDECGLDEAIALVAEILEVNNIAQVFETIKKIKGLRKTQAQA